MTARSNVLPLAALVVIFAALLWRGANGPAPSTLFAAALLLCLALAIIGASQRRLAEIVGANWIPIVAALTYVAVALATAVTTRPETLGALAHPLWRDLGADRAAISVSPYRTLEGVAAFLAPCAAFLCGALGGRERRERDACARIIAFGSLLWAGAALFAQFTGDWGFNGRLQASFVSPNVAATCAGVLALMLTSRLARVNADRDERVRSLPTRLRAAAPLLLAPFTAAALVLVVTCLLASGSRAGWAAICVALVLFAALSMRTRQNATRGAAWIAAVFAAPVAALLISVVSGAGPQQRLDSAGADFAERTILFRMHWQAFLDRPLLGHGLNTFHELNAHYASPETYSEVRLAGAAHNIYIQALEESGVVGLALLAIMLAVPALRALSLSLRGGSGREWANAALAALVFVLLHGLVDFGLQTPAIAALIAFLLGAFAQRAPRADTTAS